MTIANPAGPVATAAALKSNVAATNIKAHDVDIPIYISGIGRYLPSITRTNQQIESESQIPAHVIEKYLGVKERRTCDKSVGESASFMGARAVEDACLDAGVVPSDLDLIINASGTQERMLPDGASLIQKQLGLSDTGIPCFSVHATCISFLVAFNLAGSLLQTGIYKRIAIVSSENAPPEFFVKSDMHTYPLFGSMAVAAVVTLPPADTPYKPRITKYYMETFSDFVDMTTIKVGSSHNPRAENATDADICFQMDGHGLLNFVHANSQAFLEKVQVGLSKGQLGDIKQVIPHQASGAGMRILEKIFGSENVMTSHFPQYGNTIAAGLPGALYEAVKAGRVKRSDSVLMIGTAAGVSTAALKFTY